MVVCPDVQESYAGIYVPTLAQRVLEGNANKESQIKVCVSACLRV
jgi:carboxypeptidase C (cathepsin A)